MAIEADKSLSVTMNVQTKYSQTEQDVGLSGCTFELTKFLKKIADIDWMRKAVT